MKAASETNPVAATSEYHEMDVRLTKIEAILPTLATKSDLAELRGEVNHQMGELRAEVSKQIGDLRIDMQKMETSMHKMDASIVRWTLATVIALSLGFSGLFFTMQNSVNSRMEYLENTLLRQHGLLNPAPAVGSSAP